MGNGQEKYRTGAKTGRPSLYTKELANQIFELFATGDHTIKDVCKQVGIGIITFQNWQNTIAEFRKGVEQAKKHRLDAFQRMAKSGLAKLLDVHTVEEVQTEYINDETGKPMIRSQKIIKKSFMPNAAAVIFTLKNRDSDNWSDKQQHEHYAGSATPFESLTNDQLAKKKLELENFRDSDDDL